MTDIRGVTKSGEERFFVEGRYNWYSLKTPADLSQTSLDHAVEAYKGIFGEEPVGVLHSEVDLPAIPLLFPLGHDLYFQYIQGLDETGGWLLYGPRGVIFSEGA